MTGLENLKALAHSAARESEGHLHVTILIHEIGPVVQVVDYSRAASGEEYRYMLPWIQLEDSGTNPGLHVATAIKSLRDNQGRVPA